MDVEVTREGMLCTDMVDSEVGMEVSVNQEFSLDLHDNSSKVYRDFTNTFRDQVRRKGWGNSKLK